MGGWIRNFCDRPPGIARNRISSALSHRSPFLAPAGILYFNKEAAIPVGVVTVVLLAMLHYDRKPKSDWTLLLGGTFITFLAGFVHAGFMNLEWPLGLASALLIISPCIVYIIVYNCLRLWERIMAIFP